MPPAKSRLPPFDNSLSEDEKIVQSFLTIIQTKLDYKILKSPTKNERKVLEDAILYPGIIIGSLFGIGTFIGLRKAPQLVLNYMNKSRFPNKPPPQYQEGLFVKVAGTILDGAMASLVGLTAWTVSLDKQKVLDSAANIPLMAGNSEISNVLCDDFVKMYSSTSPRFWKTNTDDTVVAIQKFVHNCQKREMYERQIKQELGLSYEEMKRIDLDLPTAVPEDIMEKDKDSFDWAAVEDFEEKFDEDD
ncbi:hypothetical protein CTEN210_07314 [Chaetoceros tenuissimus]|uniref:Uncharacterized protein n=1 Tax=Chaetoceros tenuissimus TaxID=426638 RepID=A0AAD3H5K4_9STRA|nr:hypothetical protein CTEN210_07314 [Chaetoceros tenuissimus]